MAKIYAALILKGIKTIDDVPENLREEVQTLLESWQNKSLIIRKR